MRGRTVSTQIAGVVLALIAILGFRARADDELDVHLKTLRQQAEDRSVPLGQRETLALEIAGTLDRAAQAAPTAEGRRARWSEAIGWLDEFRKKNPGHPRSDQFNLQAAVYNWAQGRSWEEQGEFDPRDQPARTHAIESFDAALARLRPLFTRLKDADDATAQNVRFRLAQTLADRADCDDAGSDARKRRLDQALSALKAPLSEPSLQGFAHLLRGGLLARTGSPELASRELDQAGKARIPPSPKELLEGKVSVLIEQRRFPDALKAVQAASVDDAAKGLLTVRVRLAERAALPSGKERSAAEAALFRRLKTLRASGKPEARLALLNVCRSIPEPDATQGPDAWEALAEGALILGETDRASRCAEQAATRAEALGDRPRAAELRLRAGAYLFQAERYTAADALLARVVDDPQAGASRPKAGLLRALALGRALALQRPGATQQAYRAALETQIRDFPDDPSAGEARWLLGKLRLVQGERKEALALWAAIAPDAPRWLESRLAVAQLNQEDLDTLRMSNDRDIVKQKFHEARRFLADSREQAHTDPERNALALRLARLNLTPDRGRADEALSTTDRILKSPTSPELRGQAVRLHLLALAELNRYVEAERLARAEVAQASPADLLETARLLDQIVSESESDLRLRRFGLLMRIVLTRTLEHAEELSPEQRWEGNLRLTRAQLFSGNTPAAKQSLGVWSEASPPPGDRFTRDLADTYFRMEAYELAIDVQRLRARQASTGSLPWFDARYGLALAYHRAGKSKEARQLIDATAILHPDLGGGDLREKFVRLRQRLDETL